MLSPTEIASILLDINAISINLSSPFRYSSGMLSPIYCDNRLLISYPEQREQIIQAFIDAILPLTDEIDVVAGTATAGIPHAAWIAQILNKPMVYVRSSAKSHGKNNEIEGHLPAEQRVIIIEDHISTGGSALHAVDCLRHAGCQVNHCFAISNYNFETSKHRFNAANIELHCLTDFEFILQAAEQRGQLDKNELKLASQWNAAPAQWEDLFNKKSAQ